MRRIAAALLAALLALGALAAPGCSARDISISYVNGFIQSFCAQDFESAWSYFWERSAPEKDAFLAECKNVMEGLGVQKIAADNVEYADDLAYVQFDISYETKDYGTLTHPVSLAILETDDSLQYDPGLLLDGYEEGSRLARVTLTAKRGEIFTADGVLIAGNTYADTVYLDVPNVQDVREALISLADTLGLSEKEAAKVRQAFDAAKERNYGTVTVKAFARDSLTSAQREAIAAVPGAKIDNQSMTPQRYYPYGAIYAHITGYISSPNEEELEKLQDAGYSPSSVVGRSGIEMAHNEHLLGKDGYALRLYSADGQLVDTLFTQPAENGADVFLNVHSYMQTLAYYLLSENISTTQTGAAIVMNTKTGAVEASAALPSFDPSVFNFPISDADYNAMFQDESRRQPLFPRDTQGLYPPGSLLKPFTAVPALESGLVTKSTVFPYAIENNRWTPTEEAWHWLPVIRNESYDGPVNLKNAITHSDNIYFGWLALELGDAAFCDYMRGIGLGESIPYDLPTAKSNLINASTSMDRKLLSDMGFGQGQILLTPIQVISMYTAFSNNGDMLSPRLVDCVKRWTDAGFEMVEQYDPEYFKTGTMQPATIEALMEGLRNVPIEGTAKTLNIDGYSIVAKTGTALKGTDKTQESSWVCGWYDGMAEDRIVLVLVDGPRTEGRFKLQIARSLLAAQLPEEGIRDASESTQAPAATPSPSATKAPEASKEPAPTQALEPSAP